MTLAAFQTLNIVPDMADRRFAMTSIGSSVAQTVREEHSQLREVVADVCGVAPEELTPAHVEQYRARREAILARVREDPNALLEAVARLEEGMRTGADDMRLLSLEIALTAMAIAKVHDER